MIFQTFTKPRLIVAGAAVSLLLTGIFYAAHLSHDLTRARAAAAAAQAAAATAAAQTRLTAAARSFGEARERHTATALKTARETEDAIRETSDLDTALSLYRLGLERVRASGAAPVADDRPDGG